MEQMFHSTKIGCTTNEQSISKTNEMRNKTTLYLFNHFCANFYDSSYQETTLVLILITMRETKPQKKEYNSPIKLRSYSVIL